MLDFNTAVQYAQVFGPAIAVYVAIRADIKLLKFQVAVLWRQNHGESKPPDTV